MKNNIKTKSWNTIFKTFLLIFGVLTSTLVLAQNTTTETFSDENISDIIINGNQIFNISIETSNIKTITVKSLTDGEYQKEFKVITEVKDNQLHLKLKRVAIVETPDDKRNAHKVVAATLKLEIPDNLNVSIKSDIGSVKANGIFDKLKLNLVQGGCLINGVAEIATIKTTSGNINVFTKNAIISTDSKSGLVEFPNDMIGFNLWKLTTVSGNITVKKLE